MVTCFRSNNDVQRTGSLSHAGRLLCGQSGGKWCLLTSVHEETLCSSKMAAPYRPKHRCFSKSRSICYPGCILFWGHKETRLSIAPRPPIFSSDRRSKFQLGVQWWISPSWPEGVGYSTKPREICLDFQVWILITTFFFSAAYEIWCHTDLSPFPFVCMYIL